jgi:hypothetical protein
MGLPHPSCSHNVELMMSVLQDSTRLEDIIKLNRVYKDYFRK